MAICRRFVRYASMFRNHSRHYIAGKNGMHVTAVSTGMVVLL